MTRFPAIACVIVVTLLCACSKQGAQIGKQSAARGGILRVANYAEPTSLNPLLGTNTAENFISSLAFDLLVTLDDKQRDVPDLAAVVPTLENGGVSRDERTVTYHLRRNIKWQDGVPFTSADVKFSWQAVMNPSNNVVERRGYDQVSSVDTPDAYTVVFHLKKPFAPFVDTVFAESDDPFRVVPKHILARYPNINRLPFNQQPVGTGPFQVVRWYHGDHVQLAANKAYFRGVPRLAGIDVYTVPDGNTVAAQLRSNGTDLGLDLSAATYHQLSSVSNVNVLLSKAPSYNSIEFNLTRPGLSDVRVRRALAYGIDNARLIKTLEFGTATEAAADLSDFYWAYDPNVERYPYDPLKAGQLLDAAGYRRGPNGRRALTLQLVYGQGNETARALGVLIQSDLQQLGISVPIKTYPYSVLYATKNMGGITQNGKFDIVEYAWIAGADPDDSSQWLCDSVPPDGNNIANYCDRKLDAAENTALTTFDRGVRRRAYATIQSLLADDVPARFLFYNRRRYGMNPRFQNFSPNGISEGWNAYQWSLSQ